MLVQIASDLHCEFYDSINYGSDLIANKIMEKKAPTLILAGDIVPASYKERVIAALAPFCKKWDNVIYVPGNHEYYGTSITKGDACIASAAKEFPNLHVLNNGMVELEDKRILGGTLWFPQKPDPKRSWELMNDFHVISSSKTAFYEKNKTLREFLVANTREGDLVVTHHLPTQDCVAPQFVGSDLNMFFVGEAGEVLLKKPKYWVFGHTHDSVRVKKESTEMISNPMGYNPFGLNKSFNPNLVLEF